MTKYYFPLLKKVCLFTDYLTPKKIPIVVDFLHSYVLCPKHVYYCVNSVNAYQWSYVIPFNFLTEDLI
jgi:hypothetical protein